MSDYDIDILQLAQQGYCCAQIIMQMALDLQGVENPGLIRAMTGLCHGEVSTTGPCGAFSGAACLIAYYGGKGNPYQEADNKLPLMLSELAEWFREYTAAQQFAGISCEEILDEGEPQATTCGGLVAACYGKALEIIMYNGYDPSELADA